MELWKDIPNYEGLYEASNKGRIRSKEGKATSSARFAKRIWKQRIMKQKFKKAKNGRRDAMITLWKDGSPHYHIVSRLIASTFCGDNLYSKLTVNHKDGNPLNNAANNLEWLTIAENINYGMVNGQFSSMMKSISATDYNNNKSLNARSYAEMDRLLNQYHGYTSRMICNGSNVLYSKSGVMYRID